MLWLFTFRLKIHRTHWAARILQLIEYRFVEPRQHKSWDDYSCRCPGFCRKKPAFVTVIETLDLKNYKECLRTLEIERNSGRAPLPELQFTKNMHTAQMLFIMSQKCLQYNHSRALLVANNLRYIIIIQLRLAMTR